MPKSPFPKTITTLPQADITFKGVKGWLSQAKDHQVVFMDIAPIGEVAPHAHGAQWGVVLEGSVEFTIGGETKTYGRGDTYYVPDSVAHSAVIHPGFVGIDVFADAERYSAR